MELKTSDDNKINAIIFDLGNVLIKVNFDLMLINQVKEKIGRTAQEVMESAYNDALFQKFCTGKMSRKSFYNELDKKFGLNLSYAQFINKWCEIFEPMEGMAELLSDLRKKYTIGLLSDTDPIHWEYLLKTYPFLRLIINPTLSFEAGYMKPNPEIYNIAVNNINHCPNECLFIDDRLINVEGAKAIGMKAIQYTDINTLKHFLKKSGLT